MSRHVVKKYRGAGTWAVLHASSDNAGSGVPWARVLQLFDTWREAMEHADKMARTVEVVLPRRTALPTGRHTVHRNGLVIEYVRSRSQPQLPPSCVVVEPEERRPLALALLALAEREDRA